MAEMKNCDDIYKKANNYLDIGEYDSAFKSFSKLAKKNYVHAQDTLGYLYLNGYGTAISIENAITWWKKASKNNSTYAQFQLGCLYIRENNISKGIELLEIAKNNNSSDAIHLLAGYIYAGKYYKKDEDEAIALLNRAVLLGHEEAARDLMKLTLAKSGRWKTFLKGIRLSWKMIINREL